MRRAALLALGFVMAVAAASGQTFTLDFNAPTPGTLTDANGVGTGFTSRYPGTGSAIPTNDPNLTLDCGILAITSTVANYAPPPLLDGLEAPCILWTLPPSSDISIRVRLLDVNVPNGSDHAGIIVGSSSAMTLHFIVHHLNHFVLSVPQVNHLAVSPGNSFATGDDVELTLRRTAGLWNGTWLDINSGATATTNGFSLPWLDASTSISIGVHAVSPNVGGFVAKIDCFDVSNTSSPIVLPGQANSSTSRLEINGVGAGTQPGPFVVCTAPLQPLTFAWQGAPLMPIILVTGPMNPSPFTLPGFGTIHIGTPPLFNDVLVVFDGAHMSGGLQLTTSPTGTASQTVIVPAGTPPGTQIAVQGIVEQVAGTTTYGNLLTAAFRIDVQ